MDGRRHCLPWRFATVRAGLSLGLVVVVVGLTGCDKIKEMVKSPTKKQAKSAPVEVTPPPPEPTKVPLEQMKTRHTAAQPVLQVALDLRGKFEAGKKQTRELASHVTKGNWVKALRSYAEVDVTLRQLNLCVRVLEELKEPAGVELRLYLNQHGDDGWRGSNSKISGAMSGKALRKKLGRRARRKNEKDLLTAEKKVDRAIAENAGLGVVDALRDFELTETCGEPWEAYYWKLTADPHVQQLLKIRTRVRSRVSGTWVPEFARSLEQASP